MDIFHWILIATIVFQFILFQFSQSGWKVASQEWRKWMHKCWELEDELQQLKNDIYGDKVE